MPPSEEPASNTAPKQSGPRQTTGDAPGEPAAQKPPGAKSSAGKPAGSSPSRGTPSSEPPDDDGLAPTIASESDLPALEDLQGRQVGEYQLLRRLGRGGMAEVYL